MSEGEQDVGRLERLDAEDTLARFVESPWSDPRALVDRPDPHADLAGAGDRGRYLLGRLATASVVVLPQLTRELGEQACSGAHDASSEAKGGSLS